MTTGETTELAEALEHLSERLDACKRSEAGIPQSLTDHAIEIVLATYAERGRELEQLRAEIELYVDYEGHVRDVVSEYVNEVESAEKFDALLALLEDTPAVR